MYDLHLHTTCSDGDLTPEAVVDEAARRGLKGLSITDHNGLWGLTQAQTRAMEYGLEFIPGIEVTSLFSGADVHILGYSQAFNEPLLTSGLASTREGYAQRVQEMIARCHEAGYTKISFSKIEAARRHLEHPSYISYDVAQQLRQEYQLPPNEIRQLTVKGGTCYVPYGAWALPPSEVIKLIHDAGGIAVLAHGGTIAHEMGQEILSQLLTEAITHGLDGIEAVHPFHSSKITEYLKAQCQEYELLITGGSDWHGPGRFHDEHFGKVGLDSSQWQMFLQKVSR